MEKFLKPTVNNPNQAEEPVEILRKPDLQTENAATHFEASTSQSHQEHNTLTSPDKTEEQSNYQDNQIIGDSQKANETQLDSFDASAPALWPTHLVSKS